MIWCIGCGDALPLKPYMHFYCCQACKIIDDRRFASPVNYVDDGELPF